MADWMIYGAYGYTGEALAREALSQGLRPILAGRDPSRLTTLADNLGLPHRSFGLADLPSLRAGLQEVSLVVHCAGPFSETASTMRQACLAEGVHYLDITGEIDVLESTKALAPEAQERGCVMISGVGFDVVPSDCLALYLAQKLPGATSLELAIHGTGGISPGTTKTMLEGLGQGGRIRQRGDLVEVPPAWKTRKIPFPCGTLESFTIPWGDVATAFHSTGIPNIVVYSSTSASAVPWVRRTAYLAPLLRLGIVQTLGRWVITRLVHGPTPEVRLSARSYVWGRVEDQEGQAFEATLEGPEGYRLTVLSSLEITRRVLAGEVKPGSWTPAETMGPDLVLSIPGVTRRDREASPPASPGVSLAS